MKPNTIHKRQYWTPQQIMDLFGIGRTLAYDLIRDGELGPVIKVGGLRVHRGGIVQFIERKEAEMAAELDQRLL
ncbi:hypothetical protein DSCW_32010 [Desulfosarcina widdelii]|uniref:Helix-turn-helix domain-containing protein n=1 Tax=Desulfosarcina widdelii TaxID=947919 RepID=A0A5K7ZBG3_9BACT|nr:helix-turn-helix domain-containing protein [Desulfosarcina widdelii]BBO75784.1 hypothetical protein DSCW_32010 [Desulfosarcina widdelii]